MKLKCCATPFHDGAARGGGQKGGAINHLATASKLDPKILQILKTITITHNNYHYGLEIHRNTPARLHSMEQHLVTTGGGGTCTMGHSYQS